MWSSSSWIAVLCSYAFNPLQSQEKRPFDPMTRIVAIANQKGGVGKTTTTINVGSSVAAAEKRALVVDMDPQANLTSGLGIDPSLLSQTIYQGLVEGAPAEALIQDTELVSLKVLPSERDLTGAEIELVDQPRREVRLRDDRQSTRLNSPLPLHAALPIPLIQDPEPAPLKVLPSERDLTGAEIELVDQPRREFRLREFLAPVASAYDYLFIDCPPSLGLLTL